MFNELFERLLLQKEKIAVVGLGYVGVSIANALCSKFTVIGYDINKEKIIKYKAGGIQGQNGKKASSKRLKIHYTSDETELIEAKVFIIAVPTPVYQDNSPDFTHIHEATCSVARKLKKGDLIIYESTVYPGATEELCIPLLENISGLKCGRDFKVGYSPERINPGDKEHKLETIVKIVSGVDSETLNIIEKIYSTILTSGVCKVGSIQVAEAAKIIENTQRDINIAFINEVAIILNKIGIDTREVLEAAQTKWNFCSFYPGLVGGHCIGVDSYYLQYKAKLIGCSSKMISAGREINEYMVQYVEDRLVTMLVEEQIDIKGAVVAFLGITFKENCEDTRNSKAIELIKRVEKKGIKCVVSDEYADIVSVKKEYDIDMVDLSKIVDVDAIVITVPHYKYITLSDNDLSKMFKEKKRIIVDVKGGMEREKFVKWGYKYWRM